jgi:hypothetical protein
MKKHKYHVVEIISYIQKANGYPSSELDDKSFQHRSFDTKKEAKKFIKHFIEADPEYFQQWIAKITLRSITERVHVILGSSVQVVLPEDDEAPIGSQEIDVQDWMEEKADKEPPALQEILLGD